MIPTLVDNQLETLEWPPKELHSFLIIIKYCRSDLITAPSDSTTLPCLFGILVIRARSSAIVILSYSFCITVIYSLTLLKR